MLDKLLTLADRTLVLFIGIAVGAVIGMAFMGGGTNGEAVASSPPPVVIAADAEEGPPAASECATPFNRRLTQSLAEDQPVHIGVFGDSFGDGVWAAVYRAFRGEDGFVVHQFAHQSTGFTRYQSLNIFDDISQRLEEQPVDIAVVSFGANDTQGIYANGSAAAYMSPEWQEIVGQRVDAVVQLLRDHGAIVYWVGLPKMRRPEFDAQIQQMNAFYEARMRRLGVPYISTVPMTVDADGNYSAYLPHPDTGARTLARANDGIHMTGIGYSFLTGGLVERIRAYIGQARAEAEREQERRQASGSRRETEQAG